MEVNTALREVLKAALIHDGLAAYLRVLASNYNEPVHVKLVEALCAEHQSNLTTANDNKNLGEWVGLCRIHPEGSHGEWLVAVVQWLRTTQAQDVIEEYFKCKK